MSFLAPGWLWLLAAVAALGLAYLAVQSRRRRAALAYAAHGRLPDLVDRPARPHRHIGPLLLLAALAAVVVGLARPARAEAVPREEGVVVLALDVSASMEATDVAPTRLAAAIDGATEFVDGLPEDMHVGVVAFDRDASVVIAPTTDHAAATAAIANLHTGPGTASGEGLYSALGAIEASLSPDLLASGEDLPASVVLLADGMTTVGRPLPSAAAAAADLGVPVSTIAFGTPDGSVVVEGETVRVPSDPVSLAATAEATGGSAFEATSGFELDQVYEQVRHAVGTTTEPREVTRTLFGAGFVLVLAGAGLSLVLTGRPA